MNRIIKYFLVLFICMNLLFPLVVKADNMDGPVVGDSSNTPSGSQAEEDYKEIYGWECKDGECTDLDGNKMKEEELKEQIEEEGGVAGDKFAQWLKDNHWSCDDNQNPLLSQCTNSQSKEEKLYTELFDTYKNETIEETEAKKELHKKPYFRKLDGYNGCAIMGDNLKNLLGNIYKWVRGACAALVVIFGVLDFLKAITSDDAEAMKKAGNTFIKRVLVLAILVMLPHLIDFVLELMFGDSFKTCLDPFK